MLSMRVIKPLHWSASPWNQIIKLPVGSVVRFAKLRSSSNVQNDWCEYHGSTHNCRHIIVEAFGAEFMTNICMEEARLYFALVEHNHHDLP